MTMQPAGMCLLISVGSDAPGGSDSEQTEPTPLTEECTPADALLKPSAPWAVQSNTPDEAGGDEEESGAAEGSSGHTKKHAWTAEEDEKLLSLVTERGPSAWSQIAAHLPGRVGKQCRERWHNHLAPDVKKETFSEDEDRAIVEAVAEHGTKWSVIVKLIPGRTDNAIKNRWNSAIRKLLRMQSRKEEGYDMLGDRNITSMPAQELARFLLHSGLNPRGAPPRAKRKLAVEVPGSAFDVASDKKPRLDGLAPLDLLSQLSADRPASCTSPCTAAAMTLARDLSKKTPIRPRSRSGAAGRASAKKREGGDSPQVMAAALSLLGPTLGELPAPGVTSSPRTMRAAVSLVGGFASQSRASLSPGRVLQLHDGAAS